MLSGHFCLIRGPCCVREYPLSAQLQQNSVQPCCAGRVAAMPEPPISVGLPDYPHPCRAAVRLCFRDIVWARRCFIITFRSSNMPLSGQTPLLLGRRLLPMPGCGNVRCRPPLRPEPAMCTTAGRNAHMPASRWRWCSRPLQVVPRPASELCHQVVCTVLGLQTLQGFKIWDRAISWTRCRRRRCNLSEASGAYVRLLKACAGCYRANICKHEWRGRREEGPGAQHLLPF